MSHYKSYPAYKDSGVEWLGRVPEHWQIKRLKHIANVQTGVAKGKDNEGKDTIEVPYLRVANVQDGYLSLDDVATIAIPREDLTRYSLQPGDVLMNEGGDFDKLGRGSVWLGEIDPCIHQNHVFAVRPTIVSSAWLNAFTGSLAAQFYFMGRAKQSTNLASISSSNIMELPVAMPPAAEVELLLAHLNRETARIDALIEKKTRFIELLREKRQALITHAATRGLDPSVKMKDSGVKWLGEMPEHWEVRSVSSVSTKITNGYVGPTRDILVEEGVRYLQSLHIKSNQIKFDAPYFVTEEWSNQHRKSILETGDVLIVQTGDIGQVTVVTDEFAGCNCHALIIVAPERSIIAGEWMSWVFNSSYGYHMLLSIQTGAMHPHLNCGNVKDVLLPVPPLTEQLEIVKHIEHEERRVTALAGKTERSIELLKERRSALITAAVTGQIDLREAV